MNAIAPPSGAPASGPALDNRRVLAGLIDLAVIAAGVFVLATLFSMVNGTDLTIGTPIVVIALLWGLYYYFALESGDGQTLGKKVMKLRVVRADGANTSMREIAVRTVVRLLDFPMMYLVGLVAMMVTKEKRQRLGDIAAGTLVVDASATPSPATSAVAAVSAPAASTPEDELEDRPADAPPAGEPSFPVAKSGVDVSAPLEGVSTPERPDVPEVTDFEPFAAPAEEAPEPQVEVLSEVQAPDPVVEVAPEPMDAPPVEPPVQAYPSEPTVEEPAVEPAPEEPRFGHAPEEPVVAPSAEEPPFELAPVEPAAEESSVEPAPVEPAAEEPSVEPAPVEPAAEEPPHEPAPVDSASDEPVVEPAADHSFSGPAADAPSEAPTPNGDSGADQDEQLTVKSVETVSAMDLIMGDDDDAQSEQDDGPARA